MGPGATYQWQKIREKGKQDDKVWKGGNKTTKGGKWDKRQQKNLAKPVPRVAKAYGLQLILGKEERTCHM